LQKLDQEAFGNVNIYQFWFHDLRRSEVSIANPMMKNMAKLRYKIGVNFAEFSTSE
jgi:hypothetical protein